jgi:hypothetical protein
MPCPKAFKLKAAIRSVIKYFIGYLVIKIYKIRP